MNLARIVALFLFLAALSAEAQYTSAGLTYPSLNDGRTPGTCYAPGGNSCWWIDCDSVSDGTGASAASPAWGFEGVLGYYSGGSFNVGSAVGGDHVYVKGTCSVSKAVDNATGPFTIAIVARPGQLGTQAQPLVIRSWPGVTQGIFDGEYDDSITAVNDATNNPLLGLIRVHPTSAPSAKAVQIENLKIYRARRSGINCGYSGSTVAYCDISSVWFEDNDVDTNGVYAPLIVDGSATDFPQAHIIHHNKFTNNYRNCSTDEANMSGDTTCTPLDNDGALAIYSANNAVPTGTIDIYDNYFDNNVKHIRDKHNGSITKTVRNNWFGSSEGEALYDRQTGWTVRHNVFDMGAGAQYAIVVTDDPPPPAKTRSLTFYNNTIYNTSRLIDIQPGVGAYSDYLTWEVYNNAIHAPSSSSYILVVHGEGGRTNDTFTTAKWTSDHNYFNVSSSSQTNFSYLGPTSAGTSGTARSFTNTMTYLSDASSSVTDPQFANSAGDDFCLTAGASSRTAGRTSGYIGAIDPSTCGAGAGSSRKGANCGARKGQCGDSRRGQLGNNFKGQN